MKLRMLPLLLLCCTLAACGKDDDNNSKAPDDNTANELRSFTLNCTASSSHNTSAENKTSKAIISMMDGASYTYDEAMTRQSNLDFTVRTSYYNGPPPVSTADIFVGSIANDMYVGESINAFGIRNSSQTVLLAADKMQEYFVDLERKTQLDSIFAGLQANTFMETGNFTQGGKSLVAFKDHRGKRGMLTVTNYSAVKPFNFTVSVKMEK